MSGGASSGQQSWPSTSRSRSPSAIQPQSQNQSAQSSLSSNFGRNPTTPPPPLGLGLGLQNRHRSMRLAVMGDRKRKHCRWNNAVKQKCVEPGLSGLFLTCDGHEKQAVNETYNLIDQLMESKVDESKPTDGVNSDDDDDEDVADSLKRICSESREGAKKEKRCRQRPTGVKNCLFVTVAGADVVDLAERMVTVAQESPHCRYLQRVLPVEMTADVDMKKLSDLIASCVSRHLVAKGDGTFPSYALEFKARNNDSIKKTSVLEMLNDAVNAVAPSAKVDLNGAEILFYIQLVRKTIMVGGIRNFYSRKKYSMRSTAVSDTALKPADAAASSENGNVDVDQKPASEESESAQEVESQ